MKAKPTQNIRRPDINKKEKKAPIRPPNAADRKIARSSVSLDCKANIDTSSADGALEAVTKAVADVQVEEAKKPPKPACRFHPGRVVRKVIASGFCTVSEA